MVDRAAWGRAAAEKFAAENLEDGRDEFNDLCTCGHNRDDHDFTVGSLACYLCACADFVE